MTKPRDRALQRETRAYMKANPGIKYTEARRIVMQNREDQKRAEEKA